MAELFDDLIGTPSSSLSALTGDGVVIDIGTGDGQFVYQNARANPSRFYIGIDPNPRPLVKISERIHRKATKGGLPNVLFIQAAIEDLPSELDGVADEVHIHFPWGSLLRAVASGDKSALRNLKRICAPGAVLEVVIGLDPQRDRLELQRLGLDGLSADFLQHELAPLYEASGFELLESGVLSQSDWPKLKTSWARRLRTNQARRLVYIIARATESFAG